jgi:hypothetical protein
MSMRPFLNMFGHHECWNSIQDDVRTGYGPCRIFWMGFGSLSEVPVVNQPLLSRSQEDCKFHTLDHQFPSPNNASGPPKLNRLSARIWPEAVSICEIYIPNGTNLQSCLLAPSTLYSTFTGSYFGLVVFSRLSLMISSGIPQVKIN